MTISHKHHYRVELDGHRTGCFRLSHQASYYAFNQGEDYKVVSVLDDDCPCQVSKGRLQDFGEIPPHSD